MKQACHNLKDQKLTDWNAFSFHVHQRQSTSSGIKNLIIEHLYAIVGQFT